MTLTDQHNATQQVFELALARPVDAPDLQHGRLIHLMWRAPEQGERLVQFYLNGQLSGASASITQREAWLVVDHEQHAQIELLAVSPAYATVDLASVLSGVEPRTTPAASLTILRDLSLPVDTVLRVAVEGKQDRVHLFSPSDARGGFGAVFGEGGFGYDASTGPGLGLGELGYGPLGSDGFALRWRGENLPRGINTVDLLLEDQAGQAAAQPMSPDLSIDRLPDPPSDVALNEELKLTWT